MYFWYYQTKRWLENGMNFFSSKNAAPQRISLVHSLRMRTYVKAAATREQIAAHSGISRASHAAIMSIQWFRGCFPPAISAENMRMMQH